MKLVFSGSTATTPQYLISWAMALLAQERIWGLLNDYAINRRQWNREGQELVR
jgi:hypothetical protein